MYRWNFVFISPIFFFQVLSQIPFRIKKKPKGHVSYSHHLASVVRRKLFQKSFPLKVLDQWKPNLVWIITRVTRLTAGVLLPPDHRHELKFLIPITLLDMTTITVIDHGMSLSVLYMLRQCTCIVFILQF
jgi:hypothetical protein